MCAPWKSRYCFIGRLLFCVTYGADIPQIRSRSRSLANHFVEPMRDRKHESLNHHLHRCPASLLQVLHVSHTSNLGTNKGIATNGSYFSEVISEQTVTEGDVNINRLNSHVIQAVLTGNAKLLNPKLKSTRQVVPLIYAVQGLLCAIPYQLQGIGVIAQCHKTPLLFRRLMPANGSDGE